VSINGKDVNDVQSCQVAYRTVTDVPKFINGNDVNDEQFFQVLATLSTKVLGNDIEGKDVKPVQFSHAPFNAVTEGNDVTLKDIKDAQFAQVL
jgi:hypothetical protein